MRILDYNQRIRIRDFFVLKFIMENADVYHFYYDGGPLGNTKYWKDEIFILKRSGVKIINTAYGSDFYRYSRITDLSVRHVLLASYPKKGLLEMEIDEKVRFIEKESDFIIGGFLTDGRGRWDILPSNPIAFPYHLSLAKSSYGQGDGKTGVVKILHLSNHKFYTGTEFVINTIKELKEEGYKIEFFYPEKRITNQQVLELLQTYDIFIDGIIFSGYGLACIEAMSAGLPVIANLEDNRLLEVFRRYSSLNESPVVSATPENLKEKLIYLITNPKERENLGKRGREYCEKYHSYQAFVKWFEKILEKLYFKPDLNLMDYFHPLKLDR